MDVITVKRNKTAVKVTPVQRVSKFTKYTCCVGGVPLKYYIR